MRGLMMEDPLTLLPIFERVARYFPQQEIVTRRPDGTFSRTNYAAFSTRVRKLARVLADAGLAPGDRVATLLWNHAAHFEAFFAVPLAGGVLHPLNPRLHPDEIAWIARTGGDRFLIVDDTLWPTFDRFRESVPLDRVWQVPFAGHPAPACAVNYEAALNLAAADFVFPQLDERDAASMYFTSGTTGRPKGVVYSHRSLVLHGLAICLADCCGISRMDVVLPATPMFHANSWGLPHAAVIAGAKMVFPGSGATPADLLDLIEQEGVTLASGVPTIWLGVLEELRRNPSGWNFRAPVRLLVGGTAPPENLVRELDRFGLRILQAWGLTETSPLGTVSLLKPHMREWSEERQYEARSKQGYPVPLIQVRLAGAEGEAPWDGVTPGELEVRGPWVASAYYGAPESADRWTPDGWFRTGDVATIDSEGFVKIFDRTKDMIKSGGEWISSVDLENTLMAHPGVREAAVIAIHDPKWQERPLAIIVPREGARPSPEDLAALLATRFDKWQIPDGFIFVDELPRTSVGKIQKSHLREQFRDWRKDHPDPSPRK